MYEPKAILNFCSVDHSMMCPGQRNKDSNTYLIPLHPCRGCPKYTKDLFRALWWENPIYTSKEKMPSIPYNPPLLRLVVEQWTCSVFIPLFIVSILPSSHLGSQLEERRYRFTFSLMSRYPKTRADREITQLASLPCKPSTCMTRRGSGVQIPHGPQYAKKDN